MFDSKLSQEEIEALLVTAHPADGENREIESSSTGEDLSGKKVAETSKVLFNQIEENKIKKRDAQIDEYNYILFDLQIVLGETQLTVAEIINLKEDSVIILDKLAGENAGLLVNNKPFAEGEIVIINDSFAFRFNYLGESQKNVKK